MSQFNDKKSLYHFDQLDIVIIDVPANILPWEEKSHKLTQLFKQCKITNKLMLAAGQGMN